MEINCSDIGVAHLHQHGGVNSSIGILIPKGDISRTVNIDVISTRNPSTHLPSKPSNNLDVEQERPGGQILIQGNGQVGNHWLGADQEGRPVVDTLVILVGGRQICELGDLLATVGGVDVELVVVDTDLVIGVARGNGHLQVGGDEVGGGDVELVHCNVTQREAGFGGTEDEPDEKYDDEDCYDEDEEADE